MSGSIEMPQLGLTMTEGTVSEWLKKPGDFIRKNETVLTISTDKVEMEVESLVEGILGKIVVQAGETVPVGATLAYMESGAEDTDTVLSELSSTTTTREPEKTEVKPASQVAAAPQEPAANLDRATGRRSVSPRARRLAERLGVDLAGIHGSGSNGEIVEDDIRKAQSSGAEPAIPGLRRRQLIAERLTRSIQTIPTFSVSSEANAEKLLDWYESLRQPAADGVKLTITDLLLSIFAGVLKRSPELCATWENNAPRENSSIDIGLAVATPEGVVAPVLKSVDTLELQDLMTQRHELAEKARRGRLSLPELEGGVTTLSNLGMYRVDRFEAIISPGQSSILAVGSIRKRPWVSETLLVKPTVILNLTVDHRIADGATAAGFLGMLVEGIEDPPAHPRQASRLGRDGANRGRRG